MLWTISRCINAWWQTAHVPQQPSLSGVDRRTDHASLATCSTRLKCATPYSSDFICRQILSHQFPHSNMLAATRLKPFSRQSRCGSGTVPNKLSVAAAFWATLDGQVHSSEHLATPASSCDVVHSDGARRDAIIFQHESQQTEIAIVGLLIYS
jgi:hypothetical protein